MTSSAVTCSHACRETASTPRRFASPPGAPRRSRWSPTTTPAAATSTTPCAAQPPRRSILSPRSVRHVARRGSTSRGRASGSATRWRPSVEATVAAGLEAGARLSLDPNLRPDAHAETRARTAALARRASVVFPSAGELDALALTAAELVGLGALVCVTDGPRGAELLGPGVASAVDGVRAGGRGGGRDRRGRFLRGRLSHRVLERRHSRARRARGMCRGGALGDGPRRDGGRASSVGSWRRRQTEPPAASHRPRSSGPRGLTE